MNKYRVTIRPVGTTPISYLVGGFDHKDALEQGKYRWLGEDPTRVPQQIESIYAFPVQEGVPQ